MKYGILLEKIMELDFPDGYYYAHIPSIGLTTHGQGIEGAMDAARDLLALWIEEKIENNEYVPSPKEFFYSVLELEEYAI